MTAISKVVDAVVNKLLFVVADIVADVPHCLHSNVATAVHCH